MRHCFYMFPCSCQSPIHPWYGIAEVVSFVMIIDPTRLVTLEHFFTVSSVRNYDWSPLLVDFGNPSTQKELNCHLAQFMKNKLDAILLNWIKISQLFHGYWVIWVSVRCRSFEPIKTQTQIPIDYNIWFCWLHALVSYWHQAIIPIWSEEEVIFTLLVMLFFSM